MQEYKRKKKKIGDDFIIRRIIMGFGFLFLHQNQISFFSASKSISHPEKKLHYHQLLW